MTDLRHIAQLLHEAGVSEGLGPDRHGHLAGPAHPRCGTRQRERGAGAAARVGCRGGAGDHHPPQQGPGVPDRLLPRTCGTAAAPARTTCRCSTIPTTANGGPSTSGTRATDFADHQKMELEERAGRGPAPALRRADPGAPPGGAVVGRRHGQPALTAGPAALRPRRRRSWSPRTARTARADDEVEAACAGVGTVRRGRAGRRTARGAVAGRPRAPARPRGGGLRPHARRRLAPGLVLEHHPRPLHDQPAIGSEPEQRLTSDEESTGRRPCRDAAPSSWTRRRARCPAVWPTCPGAPRWARWCTACSSDSTFDSARPDVGGGRRAGRARWPGATSIWAAPEAVVAGLCAAIESPARTAGRTASALRDIARRDRLDELDFEIPLVGGDAPSADPARRRHGRPARSAPARRTIRWPATPPASPRSRAAAASLRGLPDRKPRPGVPPARRPLRRWPTTRRTGWAHRTRRSPPGTTGPRRCRPRWPRPTTRCRRCSTRWRCTATCAGGCPATTPTRHLGGVLYLFVRGMSAVEPRRRSTTSLRGLVVAPAGPAWSRR